MDVRYRAIVSRVLQCALWVVTGKEGGKEEEKRTNEKKRKKKPPFGSRDCVTVSADPLQGNA